ncbi:hypothetical protein [Paraburkholderia sp. DHOC27]|uniref:hypothetical protein n=1 Tax=Paraburkholderia sp. DHOC27 TaxID=2303330 RepID=UPI000E3BEF23|nr:hypothetical protein [Paraburkholderia sp. DHOC27]RFU44110.1 hypothetical protein D0B32_29825 [Paraburkholderia sp. DHOC27]
MSSQSASSRAAPANRRASAASFIATMRRAVQAIWRSHERHSLYEVMLAAGDFDNLPREPGRHSHQAR